jgi:hypothetical protein
MVRCVRVCVPVRLHVAFHVLVPLRVRVLVRVRICEHEHEHVHEHGHGHEHRHGQTARLLKKCRNAGLSGIQSVQYRK